MVYYICYSPEGDRSKEYVLFDIEYYMKEYEYDKSLWWSEIHSLPRIEGITRFLKDKFSEVGFDYEQFIKDAYAIQEIRGDLYEKYHNKPKPYQEASEYHYHNFGEYINKLFKSFAEKYGLWINED